MVRYTLDVAASVSHYLVSFPDILALEDFTNVICWIIDLSVIGAHESTLLQV